MHYYLLQPGAWCIMMDSQSVSRWLRRCCRWWQGWRSRPHCTTVRCRTVYCCWLRACRYCWCSHHSCSCLSPGHRYRMPTQRWSPAHRDPAQQKDAHTVNTIIFKFSPEKPLWYWCFENINYSLGPTALKLFGKLLLAPSCHKLSRRCHKNNADVLGLIMSVSIF